MGLFLGNGVITWYSTLLAWDFQQTSILIKSQIWTSVKNSLGLDSGYVELFSLIFSASYEYWLPNFGTIVWAPRYEFLMQVSLALVQFLFPCL